MNYFILCPFRSHSHEALHTDEWQGLCLTEHHFLQLQSSCRVSTFAVLFAFFIALFLVLSLLICSCLLWSCHISLMHSGLLIISSLKCLQMSPTVLQPSPTVLHQSPTVLRLSPTVIQLSSNRPRIGL